MAVILRVALFIMTIIIGAVPFIVIQKIILRTMPRYEHILPQYFHHLVCWLLGIKITVRGDISTYQPTIFIANHLSWVDIPILGSVLRGHFVAKSEMQSWPIIGWMCHLQRTIFVNRQEKHRSHQQANVIADYLKQKRNIMLFAEGTSSDGNRILPFKSSLLSVAQKTDSITPAVQAVTIHYHKIYGMPAGRAKKPLIAWYGDADLLSHLKGFLSIGCVHVIIDVQPIVFYDDFSSRKTLSHHLEQQIRLQYHSPMKHI